MKSIILIGPPGCGKGTVSDYICSIYPNFVKISTGDLLRREVKLGTDIGNHASDLLDKGLLVDDSILGALLDREIKNNDKGSIFIFDGYPRNFEQADGLDRILLENAVSLNLVLYFGIDFDCLLTRIINRFSCLNCGEIYNEATKPTKIKGICDRCGSDNFKRRSDDKKEILEARLETYYRETKPLVDYYYDIYKGSKSALVNASLGFDEIKELVIEILEYGNYGLEMKNLDEILDKKVEA